MLVDVLLSSSINRVAEFLKLLVLDKVLVLLSPVLSLDSLKLAPHVLRCVSWFLLKYTFFF